jgi:uncharacterized membrane protein
MEEVINFATNNQFTVVAVFLGVCLVTYCLFSKFFKLGLVIICLFVGLCGYFYMQDPSTAKERITNLWEGTKEKTIKAAASSSDAYTKGKGYIEAGKKAKDEALGEPSKETK